jgi:hypothetical protein
MIKKIKNFFKNLFSKKHKYKYKCYYYMGKKRKRVSGINIKNKIFIGNFKLKHCYYIENVIVVVPNWKMKRFLPVFEECHYLTQCIATDFLNYKNIENKKIVKKITKILNYQRKIKKFKRGPYGKTNKSID